MMSKIVVATTNPHKLAEIRKMLPNFEIITAADLGFNEEIAETGSTFLENAFLKARTVCQATGHAALADDSGLCVDALNGAPGVYSARYSGQGMVANRALLLKNLQGVTNRRAHFTCAMAVVFPDGREFSALGETYGVITTAERGHNGFGYDCLFLSDDLHQTFAEADPEAKNRVSHRARALAKLQTLLATMA